MWAWPGWWNCRQSPAPTPSCMPAHPGAIWWRSWPACITLNWGRPSRCTWTRRRPTCLAPTAGWHGRPRAREGAEMARISLDLAHSYQPRPRQDSDYALLPLEMAFEDGGAYALLGPSGCGKSTMLNIMSGLLVPSHGKVLFDGRDMTRASPQERNIAQVFQFPVVYDTMRVAENLASPLRNRKEPEQQIRRRVGQIAEMLELSGQFDQRAAGLAADAKQNIPRGGGRVRRDGAAVVFAEPLTVIDPRLKGQLRRKLKQIHHELQLTLIYVTHDQVEALTFADQVVVMTRGRALQTGSADALFERPRHVFVGYFIGSPGLNFLPARLGGGRLDVAGPPPPNPAGGAPPPGGPAGGGRVGGGRAVRGGGLQVGVRPEFLALAPAQQPGALPCTVSQVQDIGPCLMLTAKVGEHTLKARLSPATRLPSAGDTVWLQVLGEHTCFYQNEELLA